MKSDINAPDEWYLPVFTPATNARYILQNSLNTYIFTCVNIVISNHEFCLVYGSTHNDDETVDYWRLLFINKESKEVHLHKLEQAINEFDETSLSVTIPFLKLGQLPPPRFLY